MKLKTFSPENSFEHITKSTWKSFKDTLSSQEVGFFRLPEEGNFLHECQQTAWQYRNKKHFIHVGIGGSSLGAEAMVAALAPDSYKNKFTFINNIDPDFLEHQIKGLDLEECLIFIVSKSGSTVETMAALAILMSKFRPENLAKNFVFATDPSSSQLLELSEKWKIPCLKIPSNVGGRFSALTPVGIFPAVWTGIDAAKLLKGAGEFTQKVNLDSPLAALANFIFGHQNKNYHQTVFMPYSSLLRNLSLWFCQLWAESLGKKKDLTGSVVYRGLTPISSYGATDQHSLVQLFMEGPRDKVTLFIEIENFKKDFSLASNAPIKTMELLSPFSLGQLMKAELEGTLKAFEDEKRPYALIQIEKLDEYNFGQLIIFFESLTVLIGKLMNIDPFDQPGVELGKRYALEWLNKQN